MTESIHRKPLPERGEETTVNEQPENIADFATGYETGDTIIVKHSQRDELIAREIIGWSTVYEPSVPVIEAPHDVWSGSEHVEECAVDPGSYAGPFEWVEDNE